MTRMRKTQNVDKSEYRDYLAKANGTRRGFRPSMP